MCNSTGQFYLLEACVWMCMNICMWVCRGGIREAAECACLMSRIGSDNVCVCLCGHNPGGLLWQTRVSSQVAVGSVLVQLLPMLSGTHTLAWPPALVKISVHLCKKKLLQSVSICFFYLNYLMCCRNFSLITPHFSDIRIDVERVKADKWSPGRK